MLKSVPGRVYAGITVWYIKIKTVKLKFEKCALYYSSINKNSHFCRCCSAVNGCCMSEEKWKEASRFYHEYGTVESLGGRAENYMPALWLT